VRWSFRTLVVLVMTVLTAQPALAGVRRIAILAGNNLGAESGRPLYYAERDAEKVNEVLTLMGGFHEADSRVYLGATRNQLLRAMGEVQDDIAWSQDRGDEVVFLFYYSGHADENGLQLGRTELSYDEIDALLERSGADVKVALLDACQSGTLTRTKGGSRAPGFVFDVTERLEASGTVVITSSTGDEASQESDEIGGSYFTYFLVSGLHGAADADDDGHVTLSEAYEHVYHQTVLRTSTTRSGTQHPTFEWDLAGTGAVVLTELDSDRAFLGFGDQLHGDFSVFDATRKAFVGEIRAEGTPMKLAVRPGRYLVQQRFPTHLVVADVVAWEGEVTELLGEDFHAVEYENDLAKGSMEELAREARMPRTSARILWGSIGASNATFASSYLPRVPAVGLSVRRQALEGRTWTSADLAWGGGRSELQITSVPDVPVGLTYVTGAVGFGYAASWKAFEAAGGLRVGLLWAERSFDEEQAVPTQSMTAFAPGLVGRLGWQPGRFQLELELQSTYVPYAVDEETRGFGLSAGYLAMGYRF